MFSIEGKAVREPVTKNAFDEWLEDHLDADEETQRNMKEKLDRPRTVAKTFSEVLKFNPYHDSKGRFTSGSGGNYASFTYAPGKSKAHDNAIARERAKQRAASGGGGSNSDNQSHATSNKIKQEFIDAGLNSKFKGVQRNARE